MKTVPMPPLPDRRAIAGAAIFGWVAVSPWIWGFADAHSAVANHVALVFGFAPLALMIANLRGAAFVTLAAGVWLAISPWVLGYATDHLAWLNELVSGVVLIVLCVNAVGLFTAETGDDSCDPEPQVPAGSQVPARAPVIAETAGRSS